MDTTVDYYEVLGVPITADRPAVKAAWSDLVQRYHPDMGAEADPKKFMAVQKAYEVLTDDKKRLEYDRARDAMNPPATPDVVEDYTPGWGEASDTATASRAAAAPTTPSSRPRTREWVPPHMRDTTPTPAPDTRQTTPPAAPAPTPEPEVVAQAPKPKPQDLKGWRTVADTELKPKVSRDWKTLWLPPAAAAFLSVIAALTSFTTPGEGILGAITPVIVLVIMCAAIAGAVLDWSRIQAGRESTLGLMIAGLAAIGAVFLGFGTGNHWLTATGALSGLWVAWLLSSLRYKYVLTRQMPVKQLRQYAAFGKPGRHAPTNILQLVEQDLANTLGALFQIPSARLFHGLFVPATRANVKAGESVPTKFGATVVNGGYIGQAVTAGKRAALLTSVVWPAGHYTIDNYGGVLINGEHTQYDLDAFEEDLKNWKSHLKGVGEARMFLVVHSDGPVKFDIPNGKVELVSADDVVDTVGCWLVEEQGRLDRQLNSTMAEHLATT